MVFNNILVIQKWKDISINLMVRKSLTIKTINPTTNQGHLHHSKRHLVRTIIIYTALVFSEEK